VAAEAAPEAAAAAEVAPEAAAAAEAAPEVAAAAEAVAGTAEVVPSYLEEGEVVGISRASGRTAPTEPIDEISLLRQQLAAALEKAAQR